MTKVTPAVRVESDSDDDTIRVPPGGGAAAVRFAAGELYARSRIVRLVTYLDPVSALGGIAILAAKVPSVEPPPWARNGRTAAPPGLPTTLKADGTAIVIFDSLP